MVPKLDNENPAQVDEQPKPDDYNPDDYISRYWYGYVYAVFVAYLAINQLSHLLSFLLNPDRLLSPHNSDVAVQDWTQAVLGVVAVIWLVYVCVRLFSQKYTLGLIYSAAALHAASVLVRGLRPGEILLWLLLSGYAVVFFRGLEKTREQPVR